MKYYTI